MIRSLFILNKALQLVVALAPTNNTTIEQYCGSQNF